MTLAIGCEWPKNRNHIMTRAFKLLCLVLLICTVASAVYAQSETGTISGLITDEGGGVVPNCEVQLQSVERGNTTTTRTNDAGIYVFPSVQPGQYNITVRRNGFRQVDILSVIVNVQAHIEQNVRLKVGSVSESVTIEGSSPLLNTTDGTVGTVIDHRFVENMPLNGRSFQDLILLTPGVVTSSPQLSGNGGEFDVNGQRDDANYYTVDGVSANVGISAANDPTSPGLSGSLPGATALGTTQALISVDALQEFRVQTSTYSAEYGRSPGGQFSFVTRSGTNEWHGSAFDYLRNNFFDANDWFNNYSNTPQPALRQNDFGGTLGGPVRLPRVYNGKDKTFLFFSYEGLRLRQPVNARPSLVPDLCLRGVNPATNCTGTAAPAATALQPILSAFPIPNCTDPATCLPSRGDFSEFISAYSIPSSINSYSVRLDHVVNDRMRVFFRFGDTNSSVNGAGFNPNATTFRTRAYTSGLTSTFSPRVSNEFRLNYSQNDADNAITFASFGGSVPVNLFSLQGLTGTGPQNVNLFIFFPGVLTGLGQTSTTAEQRQWNVTDSTTLTIGRNQLKFGIDYRHLRPQIIPYSPRISYQYSSEANLVKNIASGLAQSFRDVKPYYQNFSAFVQDELRVSSRLSLSMGLRWDVNPAPGSSNGELPYTVRGSSLATLVLAPKGTPLWNTTWFNFAPRLGAAYVLRNRPHWETVVRGGGGVFFDTGQQNGSAGYSGLGASANSSRLNGKFPFSLSVVPTIPTQFSAPYGEVVAPSEHLQLPYTLQWNFAVQQALGDQQTLTISYVGSHASRLLENTQVNSNANFPFLFLIKNGLSSDYNSLQVQFQRRLSRGIQALASYTMGHSIDYGSNNATFPYTRGNSDFDVRHNFTAAVSYDLPSGYKNALTRAALGHWSLDDRFNARTGFPVTLQGNQILDPATGAFYFGELNVVPGQPFYLYGANCAATFQNPAIGGLAPGQGCPGGRAINPNAFILPTDLSDPGNAPRNFLRGFGAWQMDLAVRREFPISERLKLQFRAEAFNVFNHPNFGFIDATYGDSTFGLVQSSLSQSLVGLSSQYQTGGARSMQFALKLLF